MPEVMRVLAFIEQRYYETSLLPTKEVVAEEFEISLRDLAAIFRRNDFKTAYEARGLPSYKTIQSNDKGLLTPIQLAVANVLLNTHDRNTLRKKLTTLNVTTTQFQAWQKQPAFQDYLRRESIARFQNADVDARLGITKLVQDSDLNAIKFYMELAGIYSPNQQPILDLQRLLASVLELLVKYLAPGELLEVAEGLEQILQTATHPTTQNKPQWIETHELPVVIDEIEVLPDDDVQGDEHDYGLERDSTGGSQGINISLSGLRI